MNIIDLAISQNRDAVVVESQLIYPYLHKLSDALAVSRCLCRKAYSLFWGWTNEERDVSLFGRGVFLWVSISNMSSVSQKLLTALEAIDMLVLYTCVKGIGQ